MNNVEKKGNNNSGVITISGAFHDLTHLISQDMPVYPGDPQPEFEASATIEKEEEKHQSCNSIS